VAASSNLTVAGESTFAGRATFESSVTFSTVVTFHADQTFGTAGQVPAVKCTHSGNQSIGVAAWTGLSWDVETYDDSGLHSTASNSSRINLTSSGLWVITVGVEWASGSSGQRHVRLRLNDGNTTLGCHSSPTFETNGIAQQVTTRYRATSTSDYVTAVVYQQSGGNINIVGPGSTSFGGSWIAAERIGT